jgi:uncharacterized glyoxalase superfamily protein PhnB
MKPECAATIFQVSNMDASIQYYTAVLSFTLEFRYNDLAGMEYGPVLIYLSGPGQDLKRKIGQGSIYIFCDEVDLYFKDISIKGALVEVPIDDRAYGMRDFAIKDPDGNALTFGINNKV